jgi:UDP-N-acetylmuramate dehydrogenase
MDIRKNHPLAPLTTFKVQASAETYIRFAAEDEILDFLACQPLANRRWMVLGGGSNLLFVEDFDGVLLHPALQGTAVLQARHGHVLVKAMAGEKWDDLVALAVANGWGGVENLSHIPGSVGASAVQNIGAYGVEVKDVIERIEAISIPERRMVTIRPQDCGFAYRYSHFKGPWQGRFLITAVVFRLCRQPALVTHYPGVLQAVEQIGALNLKNLRKAIVAIRQGKLPDPARLGNAGSFFKNPVVSQTLLDGLLHDFPDLPRYPQGAKGQKLAAAWLIEKCGWKGRAVGQAAVHDRQALVLVNRGGATGREIFDLSEAVRRSVYQKFGVELEREVLVVGSQPV